TVTSSGWRCVLSLLLLLAALAAAIGAIHSTHASGRGSVPGSGAPASKIVPWVMEHTANGQKAEFFVELKDQADLSGAASLPTKAEKGRYVYNTLLSKAQSTQEPVLQWLRERGIEHQSFYIINAILVKANRQVAETLASRPDVARISGNPVIHNDLPRLERT